MKESINVNWGNIERSRLVLEISKDKFDLRIPVTPDELEYILDNEDNLREMIRVTRNKIKNSM